MRARTTWAVAVRVLTQIRRDPRTLVMLVLLPSVLMVLLWWIFSGDDARPGPDRFDSIGPGLLAIFPLFVMFLVASVTTLRERSGGTLERLLAMPMGKGDFVLGYALAFGLLGTIQAVLATTVSVWGLGMEVRGPLWLLVCVAVSNALVGTALGLFVSAFARTEFQAVQFLPAVVVPQILLCGLLTPRADLPTVLHWVSSVLPLSYGWDAMQRLAASTGVGAVLGDLAIVLGFALLAVVGGVFTLRRRTE